MPNTVRGKFTAVNSIFATLVGLAAIFAAGAVIERSSGLSGYMLLFVVGGSIGLLSAWFASRIPGGAPVDKAVEKISFRSYLEPVRDQNFIRYIIGASTVTLAIVPLASFLPLFMQEEVGLSSGNTIMLQTGVMVGGLLSTFFWGWAADRYGGQPVTLSGISLLVLLPVCWLLMPRHSLSSLYVAMGISFLQGIANMGWAIGSSRLLYVNVVPTAQKTVYMAVYYAALDVMNGLSKILGGQIVEWSAGIEGQFLFLTLDPYLILFLMGLTLPLISLFLLRQIRSDTGVSVSQFAALFIRGNTFSAMNSLIRFQFAGDEAATVAASARLGKTRSGLTVNELLLLLKDPRFNVRFETIISIARTRPDSRLTQALIDIFTGTELSLSVVSAWALGRIQDPIAAPALRAGLDSPYRSIRAHSARALGTLGDLESIPLLLERLAQAEDKGLQMAYASTLGQLKAAEATVAILRVLASMSNPAARWELTLALARIVGDETAYVRLIRRGKADLGKAASQALLTQSNHYRRQMVADVDLLTLIDQCMEAFSAAEPAQGVALLCHLIDQVIQTVPESPGRTILLACRDKLSVAIAPQPEYIALALHVLGTAAQRMDSQLV